MSFTIAIARSTLAVAASVGFCLMIAAPARADGGGGGGGDSSSTTCPRGEVYDARSMSCVRQRSCARSRRSAAPNARNTRTLPRRSPPAPAPDGGGHDPANGQGVAEIGEDRRRCAGHASSRAGNLCIKHFPYSIGHRPELLVDC